MAAIYVAVHNQSDVAMSSINGELILVLIARDGLFEAQQPVDFRTATATFQDVPAGNYTIVARHPDLTPTETRYDVGVAENAILGVRYTYNETQRRLLLIETEMRFLP